MSISNIPRIYDHLTNKRIAFLENAYSIGYNTRLNGLSTAQFTLPADDPKNEYCQPFNLVEIYDGTRRVELFRIMPAKLTRNKRGDIVYNCEHVLATLMDNVLFGYHQIGNLGVYTKQCIQYLIDKQNPVRWELGVCEFSHQFEYKWENDNLLAAMFSIPKPFLDGYYWDFDTTGAIWIINLKRTPDKKIPDCELRYKKNMIEITKKTDPTKLITRLYALGYGEGDNQLNITNINGGKPYIEDLEAITKYGIKEKIFVDRRYENPDALLSRAKVLLEENKKVYTTYTAEAADLYLLTGQEYDYFQEGKLIRIVDKEDGIIKDLPIIEIAKNDITGEPYQKTIIVGNTPEDISSSIAELADRARINELYAQGATNQFMVTFADNADVNIPAVLPLFIPDTMHRINKCVLNFSLEPFRAFSKSVTAAQQQVQSTTAASQQTQSTTATQQQTQTTSSQSQQTQTTSNLAQQTQTTSSQSQQTQTTSSQQQQTPTTSNQQQQSTSTESGGDLIDSTQSGGGDTVTGGGSKWFNFGNYGTGAAVTTLEGVGKDWQHAHVITADHSHNITLPSHKHSFNIRSHSHDVRIPGHSHTVTIPAHSHTVTIPGHDHTVTIPAHSHTVTIPGHDHTVTIPAHSHTVTIPEHNHSVTIPEHTHNMEFGIFQGTTASKVMIKIDGKAIEEMESGIDIIKYLAIDSGGKIRRNYEHKIEIYPDKMTRISASVFCQIFTNSRGGGDY